MFFDYDGLSLVVVPKLVEQFPVWVLSVIHRGIIPLFTAFIKLMVEDGGIPVRIACPDHMWYGLPLYVSVRLKRYVGQPILDSDWVHVAVWGLDVLKSAWYPNWLLVNLKPKFLELNTRMNGVPSSQMSVLMEDGDHRAMLHLYHTACSHNLEISDLVITDSLDIDGTVHHLNDANVCTCYATIRTAIDEGTRLVSSVFAHTVGEVRVGLTGLVCSTLRTCGQYIAEVSRRGIISCSV